MIRFILNNKTIETSRTTGMTLLDFVRHEKRHNGTKIGCRDPMRCALQDTIKIPVWGLNSHHGIPKRILYKLTQSI
ncbi:MAG: hypothetical protein QNJ57_09960 [Flavobacteriaceae bacterium]|nr:hypothetical protein [Flavobacteriaceae bacterium]